MAASVGTKATLPPPLVRAFWVMVTGWSFTNRVPSLRYSAGLGGASLYLPLRGNGSLKAQCLISPWAKGDKAEYRQRQTAEWLASEGYAVLSVNYLLSKFAGEILKSQPTRSCWPECLHDCRAALLIAGERAKLWNIDPNRISLLGFSAGAHLALLTAVTNGHPELDRHGGKATAACVLAFYGIYDLHPLASRWCFGEPAENPQQLQRQASPVSYLHANVPPVFLAHGESDKTVPVQQTSLLAGKLAELKVPHDVILLPKAPHGFRITSEFGDLRPSVLAFLEAHSS